MKVCGSCHEVKDETEFYFRSLGLLTRVSKCKVCCRRRTTYRRNYKSVEYKAAQKRWRKRHPKYQRNANWKFHGIPMTIELFQQMLVEQNNRCAICQKYSKRLAVDHSHATGKVRGLLCGPCNSALGLFKDNQEHLFAAVNYLRKTALKDVANVN